MERGAKGLSEERPAPLLPCSSPGQLEGRYDANFSEPLMEYPLRNIRLRRARPALCLSPGQKLMPVSRNGPLSLVLLTNPPTNVALDKCVLYFVEEFRVLEGFKKKGRADLGGDGPDREIVTAGYDDEASFRR
jgi:hypothetical protein